MAPVSPSRHPNRPAPSPVAPPAIDLRPARLDDLEPLLALEQACFATDRLSRRSFRRFIDSPASDCIALVNDGRLAGYALILYRRGTSVARLYSIALDPACRGQGLGRRLMAAVEQTAYDRDASELHLEVRQDNAGAITFYRDLGYRRFGRISGYYEDGMDAERYQKRLTGEAPAGLVRPPYYAQTTDFTCGPAALLMAMQALDATAVPDRTAELALWREATTIYMLRGHGGCEPIGLANALLRRGFAVDAYCSSPGPYFLESVRFEHKRTVMQVVQADYAAEAERLGLSITDRAMTREDLIAALDRGQVAVVLVSHFRLTRSPMPHWIMVYGHDGHRFYLHDPWVELDKPPDEDFHGAALPVPFDEFDRITRYGRFNLRIALMVGAPAQRP